MRVLLEDTHFTSLYVYFSAVLKCSLLPSPRYAKDETSPSHDLQGRVKIY